MKRVHVALTALLVLYGVALTGLTTGRLGAAQTAPTVPLNEQRVNGDLRLWSFGEQILDPAGNPYQFDPNCPVGENAISGGYRMNWARGFAYIHCGRGTMLLGNTLFTDLYDPVDVRCQRASSNNGPLPDVTDRSDWALVAGTNLCGFYFRGYAGDGAGFAHGDSAGVTAKSCEDFTDTLHNGGDLILNTRPRGVSAENSIVERMAVTCEGYIRIVCADSAPTTAPPQNRVITWYDCTTHAYKAMDWTGTVRTLADWSGVQPSPPPPPAAIVTPALAASVTGDPVTVTWAPVDGATSYYLAVGTPTSGDETIYTSAHLSSTTSVSVPMMWRADSSAVPSGTLVKVRLFTCRDGVTIGCPGTISTFTYGGP